MVRLSQDDSFSPSSLYFVLFFPLTLWLPSETRLTETKWTFADYTLYRYLKARDWKFEASKDMILETMKVLTTNDEDDILVTRSS
jgi:hypothetical protein